MDYLMVILLTIFLIPVFLIIVGMPYWTRKTESFGVSIPEDIYYTEELKSMRKSYATLMIGVSIITTLIFLSIYFFITKDESVMTNTYTIIVISYLIGSFFVYLVYHRQMKRLKQAENWAQGKEQHVVVHTKFHYKQLTVSNWLYMIPLLLSLFTIVWTLLIYDKFPEQIPMNYSLTGEITNWATKSYRTVLTLPITQLFLVCIFIFVNIIISRSKQQVSAKNPQASMMQNIIFRRRWSIFLFISGLALTIMFSIVQISFTYELSSFVLFSILIIVTGGILVGSIVLAITTGQGGSRVRLQDQEDTLSIDRDDDKHWKLGQFYFNREDPSIFLEKRFGIGWTINLARPMAWVFIFGIILLAVGIPLMLTF